MTKLSSTAQEVMDAYENSSILRGPALAATLRAVANEVMPEHRNNYPNTLDERYRKISVFELRNRILSIAAELENHDAP